jgi:tRNA uridine 5-carboxymethylaminomethyl modification enzyme gidA
LFGKINMNLQEIKNSNKYSMMGEYDVVVVGAGHAGCEAGLAAARIGCETLLLSMNLESVAMMPCNPSIGGTGKGHLVCEIDALGGEMGLNIDKTFIQSKMLNTSKGPAVHSLRAQADKTRYHLEMKKTIENEERLSLKQAEVVDLIIDDGAVCGVVTRTNSIYLCKAVIMCTGTFLAGKVFIGESAYYSGPSGLAPSMELADKLHEYGLPMRRFKTGTPARMLASTLDYDKMKQQDGDEEIIPFSFMNEGKELGRNQISCWLSYTNSETHRIILENIERSAMYSGNIVGVGPRYCPSIEDKVSRFKDRDRHQLFVEPEGLDTDEMYIQGMSSSLPEDVQEEFYHTIPGLENAEIVRPAYAIEYDCVDPTTLKPSLESKLIDNMFCAGQFNGSSGYEEAAAQGLIAGINAARKINGENPLVLGRNEAYIGVLIDDLVTKGTMEPYRIMTSRAEFRLILRQDNADRRLTEIGYEYGLVSDERYSKFITKKKLVDGEIERLRNKYAEFSKLNEFLASQGSHEATNNNITFYDLLRRPEISYEALKVIDDETRPELNRAERYEVEVRIKYAGYIDKQLAQVEKMKKLENKKLPENINYNEINGLRLEARQKLSEINPISIGQASRISGVSPADINVLLIYLEKERRSNERTERNEYEG